MSLDASSLPAQSAATSSPTSATQFTVYKAVLEL
uniref:Uncharacterized protein n=1 Tax=Anguilla anguilla TaxID=7936 RepID=A0A0E9UCY2_ANGAN